MSPQSYAAATPEVAAITTGAGHRVKIVHPMAAPIYIAVATQAEAEQMVAALSEMFALSYQAGQQS